MSNAPHEGTTKHGRRSTELFPDMYKMGLIKSICILSSFVKNNIYYRTPTR